MCVYVRAHAQVVKRVVGLYDNGYIKPCRAGEGQTQIMCAGVALRRADSVWAG